MTITFSQCIKLLNQKKNPNGYKHSLHKNHYEILVLLKSMQKMDVYTQFNIPGTSLLLFKIHRTVECD